VRLYSSEVCATVSVDDLNEDLSNEALRGGGGIAISLDAVSLENPMLNRPIISRSGEGLQGVVGKGIDGYRTRWGFMTGALVSYAIEGASWQRTRQQRGRRNWRVGVWKVRTVVHATKPL
jgi:hypothetical protein